MDNEPHALFELPTKANIYFGERNDLLLEEITTRVVQRPLFVPVVCGLPTIFRLCYKHLMHVGSKYTLVNIAMRPDTKQRRRCTPKRCTLVIKTYLQSKLKGFHRIQRKQVMVNAMMPCVMIQPYMTPEAGIDRDEDTHVNTRVYRKLSNP